MVALCFTAFPSEADASCASRGIEKGRRAPAAEHYKEIERYVKSLKKDELQKQLYNALLELEERNNPVLIAQHMRKHALESRLKTQAS